MYTMYTRYLYSINIYTMYTKRVYMHVCLCMICIYVYVHIHVRICIYMYICLYDTFFLFRHLGNINSFLTFEDTDSLVIFEEYSAKSNLYFSLSNFTLNDLLPLRIKWNSVKSYFLLSPYFLWKYNLRVLHWGYFGWIIIFGMHLLAFMEQFGFYFQPRITSWHLRIHFDVWHVSWPVLLFCILESLHF